MIGTGNENLFHFRFNRKCGWADTFGINRHFAVSQNFKAEFFSSTVENIAAFFSQPDVLGKEHNAYTILSKRRKMNAQFDTFIKEKFMGHLDHNAGAIAGIVFAATGTAVLHVFQARSVHRQ